MNIKTALKQAQKRWGKTAIVQDRKKPAVTEKGVTLNERFLVGRVMMGMFFEIKGDGKTWELAFAKADETKAREDERYRKLREEAFAARKLKTTSQPS